MGIFGRLFSRSKSLEGGIVSDKEASASKVSTENDRWISVPNFVPLPRDQWTIPAAIVTACVANDHPSSSFSVRSIEVANPEACRVAAIVAACAAQNCPSSAFSLRSVSCRKSV
jgi:hypothetical protein